ncbi:FecCD family ABC transporter permease [Paractinoplanes lichenicola]|uniref:Iron chelate uptake ABC transporter family permease subunit n=1 Tax=Paractinoplanes lichenicola TaxID=2802976 RepID=A0ABS1VED2_9ACTN|nr:iron chelate uptake ABC transporter family permease subunit [Actinoplanes lichenicola]MBL7253037.1 iron chelate uptake ABC transporter family permease subunit [Actinoplanes lichenicola]
MTRRDTEPTTHDAAPADRNATPTDRAATPTARAGTPPGRGPALRAGAFRMSALPISGVVPPRTVAVCLALIVATFGVLCVSLALGDYPVSLPDVLSALVGGDNGGSAFIVRELRLPRALTGLLVGAAFAVSGAIFQTITRNPLASPDMIGINAGATTAVVGGIVLGVGSGAWLGVLGALATAALIYLLAWRRGASGYRIVLVGIGVAWMCTSATDYLLTHAKLHEAQEAFGWLVGSINGRGWETVGPLALAVGLLLPLVLLLTLWSRTLALGDDVARGLGTPVQRARFGLLLAGVGLVAFATAAAGPVLFVALAAPQVAQRLAGQATPPPATSALTGAFMVLVSDLLARYLIPDADLPVGVVTGALGAAFLLWLLARANRAGAGG